MTVMPKHRSKTTGSTPPSRRRAATVLVAALVAALGLVGHVGHVGHGDVAGAATKKPTKSTSTAKFCSAAKGWLAFENETLESGPYDAAWVLGTYNVLRPLGKAAPKAIRGSAALFILTLLGDRREIAGVVTITSEDEEAWLREYAADETGNSTRAARDAVGAYILKTCKIDHLQPFRDLAAGFE